ncbi:hypothetical protein [Emergencia sp.]|uniref:hypothetical protein n=1 Tax=Emergencia sp. TaxID=1926557 RepID=UPI003AF1D56F
MAKQAYVVLKLKDQFSKPLQVAKRGTKEFERQSKLADQSIKYFGNTLNNKFKKAVKASAVALGALGLAATKVGFSEAIDLEGYRTQLETATKDTKKAADIMRYAIDLANKTPFEGGELVEGAAKFESMGMSAKKWLTYAGDMAGATNKSFDQSVEALIDAQAGELERLKEFGITKRMIVAKAEKLFKNEQVVNNQGQIVNQKKFNKALLSLMSDKFAGGMEKQSRTLKGLWSTVTGVTKNALANIVGMTNDGEIRAGSAMDILKGKIQSVADTLAKWQNDGTLDALAQKVGDILSGAIRTAANAFKWLKDNLSWLKPVIMAVVIALTAFNIINAIATLIQSFTIIINVLKIAFTGLNTVTIGWTLIIGAVIAIIYLLITNWKQVVVWLGRLKDRFMAVQGPIGALRDAVLLIISAFKDLFDWLDKTVGKIKDFLGLDTNKTVKVTTIEEHKDGGRSDGKPTRHALGTTYFAGGRTGFSEGGRAEEAVFPSGTRIIPADKAGKNLGGGGNINVNLTIQGNMIGNQEYMEMIGSYIVAKVQAAKGNI